jgi:hypothetical protein
MLFTLAVVAYIVVVSITTTFAVPPTPTVTLPSAAAILTFDVPF